MDQIELEQIISKYSPEILKYEKQNIINFLLNGGLDINYITKQFDLILKQDNFKKIDTELFKIALHDLTNKFIEDKIPPYFLIENLKILKIKLKSKYKLNKKKVEAYVSYKNGLSLILPSKIKRDKQTIDMLKHELKHIASYYENNDYQKMGLISKNKNKIFINHMLNETLIDIYSEKDSNEGYYRDNFKVYPIIQILKDEIQNDIYSNLFLGEYSYLLKKYPFLTYINILLNTNLLDQTEIINKIEFLLDDSNFKKFADLKKLSNIQNFILEYYKSYDYKANQKIEEKRLVLFKLGVEKLKIKYNLTKDNQKRTLIIKKENIESNLEQLEKDLIKLDILKYHYIKITKNRILFPFSIFLKIYILDILNEYSNIKDINPNSIYEYLVIKKDKIIQEWLYYQIELKNHEINEIIEEKNKIKK